MRSRGRTLSLETVLSPEEAANGGVYMVPLPVRDPVEFFGLKGLFSGLSRDCIEKKIPLEIPAGVESNSVLCYSLDYVGLHNIVLEVSIFI